MNVEALEREDNSILRLYRHLIQLRQTRRTLVEGKLQGVAADGNVLRYERSAGKGRLLVVLNMSAEPAHIASGKGTILISTHLDREQESISNEVELRAAEGLVISLTA